jgi:hypothetical protein
MSKEKRFVVTYQQQLGSVKIIVDTETGVQYFYVSEGYSGGMSVLVDRDGKPIIDPNYRDYNKE